MRKVMGEGPKKARLMLVGEAPGREEAEKGRPFVGRAGRFLSRTLENAGIDRKKAYITNVVKVRPTKVVRGKTKDRVPTKQELEKWLPVLKREIARARPKLIILLGNTAIGAMLGKGYPVGKWHGKRIKKGGKLFMPTYHPASAMRNRRQRAAFVADLKKAKRLARL